MSEDQDLELDYVNDPVPTAERHNTVHSGRRLKVTVLSVAVVLAVVLIVAYVFDGVALFLHCKEGSKGLQTTTNQSTVAHETPPTNTTTKTETTKATATSSVQTCPTKLHCDTDWELNGRMCYYFSTNELSWIQSEKKCVTLGGHLVKIDSREEQRFLNFKLETLMSENKDKFWIGLTDFESEGEWKWTDGSELNARLAFWVKNTRYFEPNNWTNYNLNPEGEDCALMGEKNPGHEEKCWFDHHCSLPYKYICEKKPTPSPECQ